MNWLSDLSLHFYQLRLEKQGRPTLILVILKDLVFHCPVTSQEVFHPDAPLNLLHPEDSILIEDAVVHYVKNDLRRHPVCSPN
jgi:hypothetical protein